MAKTTYSGKFFRLTHTLEETGPHLTHPNSYFDETFTVCVLLRGKGKCYVNSVCYPLQEGDILILGMDEIRLFQFEQEGCHERMSLYCSSSVLSPLWEYELPLMRMFFEHPSGTGNKLSCGDYDRSVLEMISQLCNMVDSTQHLPEPDPMLKARMHLLVLQILFALYDSNRKLSPPEDKREYTDTTYKISRYIHDHLAEDLTQQRLQEQLQVSRYQLTKVFRKNTGMSLSDYILQTRLIKVSALVQGGMGLEGAAYHAGFRSYSHFYKQFVKNKGVSPSIYYQKRRD